MNHRVELKRELLELDDAAKIIAEKTLTNASLKYQYTNPASRRYSLNVHIQLLKMQRDILDQKLEKLMEQKDGQKT